MIKVFVYGTLRPSLFPMVKEVFNLTEVGKATLRGPFKMLNLGSFPGLVDDMRYPVTPIYGEVVGVKDLRHLDAYEGYPTLYTRKQVNVKLYSGATETAWVYLYNGSHDKPVVKSGDWGIRG